ncbi:MAG: hypothetical protein AAFX79_10695 [Planctomycetota bacterium]
MARGANRGAERGAAAGRWAVAVPVSVLAHVALAVLVWQRADAAAMAASANASGPEIPIKLGIDRSEAVTPTWLGFETPTPHSARLSTTEQSPLTRAEGEARDDEASAAAASEPQPPAFSEAEVAEAMSRMVGDAGELIAQLRGRFAAARAEAAERARDAAREAAREAEAAESTPRPESTSQTGDDGEGEGSPGIEDDREADATSRTVEIERAQLGRVVAAEGLRINTSRLELTDLQRFIGRPPSPLVELFFDYRGRVISARIPPGRGTGRSDIDASLTNAMYEWTAMGARIEAMVEGDEPLLVRMRIRF